MAGKAREMDLSSIFKILTWRSSLTAPAFRIAARCCPQNGHMIRSRTRVIARRALKEFVDCYALHNV